MIAACGRVIRSVFLFSDKRLPVKLLFIYGPPAVGKLTVANEVARLTGFKVFHNHLSIDAIEPVFAFGTLPFAKLVSLIRIETVTEAARQNVDLIYTFCFAKGHDEAHVETITRAVTENGGEVHFVLLTCSIDELKTRVVVAERRRFGKAKTAEMVDYFLETYDLYSPVPGTETLTIDNTATSAEDAAKRIVEHFALGEVF
jgi:hypothetical protein